MIGVEVNWLVGWCHTVTVVLDMFYKICSVCNMPAKYPGTKICFANLGI